MPTIYKVIMTGAPASGKSTLRHAIYHADYKWGDSYISPSITTEFSAKFFEDIDIKHQVWDIPESMISQRSIYPGAKIIVLTIDSTQRETSINYFSHLSSVQLPDDVAIIVVYTKCDKGTKNSLSKEDIEADIQSLSQTAGLNTQRLATVVLTSVNDQTGLDKMLHTLKHPPFPSDSFVFDLTESSYFARLRGVFATASKNTTETAASLDIKTTF